MMDHHEVQDLLGALALGAVSGAEWQSARHHFDLCADCRDAAAQLRSVVDTFPVSARETTPPPALRSRIMAAIAETPPSATYETIRPMPVPPSRDVIRRAPRMALPAWLRFAPQFAVGGAAIVFLVLAGWSNSMRNRLDQAESELSQTRVQLAGLGSDNIFTTNLRSTNLAPTTRGNLVYMTQEKAGMVMVWNLPQPKRGNVYQVWAQVNGQIRSLGALTLYPDGNGVIYLPTDLAHLKAVMITMEPEPMSPSPTGDVFLEARIP